METFPKSIIGLERVPQALRSCVLTIGNFDGVHLGHQQILREARALASDAGGRVVVLTFEPHPLAIVAPDRAPARLMTGEQRSACLLAAGVDAVVVARSDSALLSMEPADFVRQIIVQKFAPTHAIAQVKTQEAALKESVHILYAGDRWGKTKKGPKSFVAERVFLEGDRIYLGNSVRGLVRARRMLTGRGKGRIWDVSTRNGANREGA